MSSVPAFAVIFSAGIVSGIGASYALRRASNKPIQLEALPAGLQQGNGTPLASRPDQQISPSTILRYGLPSTINDIGVRQGFVSGYDRRMRNPSWVAEHLTPERLQSKHGDRGKSTFVEDQAVPAKFRALLRDYARSGYDRGHQVPAADCKFSQTAMDETFVLTNICPQVGDGFNRDYWAHFEDFCRRLTLQYKSVRVITGPLYLPRQFPDGKWRVQYEVIGSPANVAVPTHFYKVIVADQGRPGDVPAVGGFVLPNAPIDNGTPLTEFATPVEAIERASGIDMLPALPPNRRKNLCSETQCSIVVRFFEDRKDRPALPPPKARL